MTPLPAGLDTTRDLRRFLARWFGHMPSGHAAELKCLRKRPGPDYGEPGPVRREATATGAERLALRADADGWDVFLAALPRRGPDSARRWLFADLDFGPIGHGKTPPHATEEGARAALGRVPAPTLLVHSGGGLQAWWALHVEPEPEAWQDAIRRLVAVLDADPAAASSRQVLRVPGTHNWKTGAPRPVRLLEADGEATDLGPFLALPEPPAPAEARPSGGSAPGGGARGQDGHDRPFERAKDVPVADVLAWLGVPVTKGRCRCPCHDGRNPTSMQVGGDRGNVATCYAGCATTNGPRAYTTVDLVARVKDVAPREAVNLLAAQFGFRGFSAMAKIVALRDRRAAVGREAGGGGHAEPPAPPAPPSGPPEGEGPAPPRIVITTREKRVATEALAALVAQGPDLYARGGKLVTVVHDGDERRGVARSRGAPRMQTLAAAQIRSLLSDAAEWVRPRPKEEGGFAPAHVPDWAVKDLETRGNWPGIRPLEGVVECPVLRPDGTVLERPGYDPDTGLLYLPNGAYPHVPEAPTREDAQRALGELGEVVADFPFDKPCHRAAWFGALLTPFARHAFRGCIPLFLVDANVRGAGKSLLTDCIAEVFGGRPMGGMTQATDDSEERKRITSLLLDGSPLLLIDNITRPLGSDGLVMVLTREEWSDRALGGNDTVRVPNLATWYATGNNVQLRGDMGRRVVHIRLNSPDEQPERRTAFKRSPLLAWVREERGRLAACAVTVLRAYCRAGGPPQALSPWGSFDGWSALVRGALVWAGEPDPGEARDDLVQVADQETNLLHDLLAGWAALDPDAKGMTTGEVLGKLEASPTSLEAFRAAVCELTRCPAGKLPSSSSLGAKLRSVRGRNVGGRCIDLLYKAHGYNRWVVRAPGRAPEPPPAPPASPNPPPEDEPGVVRVRVWP